MQRMAIAESKRDKYETESMRYAVVARIEHSVPWQRLFAY